MQPSASVTASASVAAPAESVSQATDTLGLSGIAPELIPHCPNPVFTPAPQPDIIAKLFSSEHKHYRLVIGASKFKSDSSLDRPFVESTAALIDKRLDTAGYMALPNVVATQNSPYLTGEKATKSNINKAIEEMAALMGPDDFAIIYYVGHGSTAPNHIDTSLSVYDKPVAPDEGIRVSDIVGTLGVDQYLRDIKQLPHYIIVLETCYSGSAVATEPWTVVDDNGNQRLGQIIGGPSYPPQIVVIAATAPAGLASKAYDLHGTNLSAFGVFFLRALNEDWECADSNQDGILTLNELADYIKAELKAAYTLKPPAIDGPMSPRASSDQPLNFLAYSAARHVIDGDRNKIGELYIKPGDNQSATVTLPSGASYVCTQSQPCSVAVSKDDTGQVLVATQPISDPAPAPRAALTKGIFRFPLHVKGAKASSCTKDCVYTSPFAREATTSIAGLLAKTDQVLAGVHVQLK
jgi:hypothetical protein